MCCTKCWIELNWIENELNDHRTVPKRHVGIYAFYRCFHENEQICSDQINNYVQYLTYKLATILINLFSRNSSAWYCFPWTLILYWTRPPIVTIDNNAYAYTDAWGNALLSNKPVWSIISVTVNYLPVITSSYSPITNHMHKNSGCDVKI